MLRPRLAARISVLAIAVFVSGCDALPLSPHVNQHGRSTTSPAEGQTAQTPPGSGLLTKGTRLMDPGRWPLVSTGAQLASGEYRFKGATALADSIARDDVIVAAADGHRPTPRRVLSVRTQSGVLIVETGPALWSDVIRSGTYSLRLPLKSGTQPADISLPGLNLTRDIDVPPLQRTFEYNVCAGVDSLLASLPNSPTLCGEAKDLSVTAADVNVTLSGVIDSMALLDSNIQVSGSMALDMMVDGGGIRGGTPPTFSPCNRAAYPGCISTPTGANLIDWIRRFAPSVPDSALPAVRVCLPGSWVRVKPGHWEGLRWVLPQFERCRITDVGTLPTVVLPSVQQVHAVIQPRIRGATTLFVQGDGKLTLKLPIPEIGYQVGEQLTPVIKFKGSIGVFLATSIQLKNTGAKLRGTFDEEVRVTQSWNPQDGWSSSTTSIRSDQNGKLLDLLNPDSVVFRMGLPVEAVAKFSLADSSSSTSSTSAQATQASDSSHIQDWVDLGANAGLSFQPLDEVTWSREQIDPDSAAIDNWHLSTDMVYELTPSAGIKLPTIFFQPKIPTSFDSTFELGRFSYADEWGHGTLVVTTSTTGTAPDPDGYSVVVSRADSLPAVVDPGARRVPAFDSTLALTAHVGANDSVGFDRGISACAVAYSDALLPPGVQGVVAGARKLGVDVPNYAAVAPTCNTLLIARHKVALRGVSDNCTVVGGAVRDSVWLLQRRYGMHKRSDTTRVHFDVQCAAAGSLGSAHVTANVPAVSNGPLDVLVDGSPHGIVSAGDTVTVSGLVPGSREFRLAGLPSYCTPAPDTVQVLQGQTVALSLIAACTIPVATLDPGQVGVSLATTGTGQPPDAFRLTLDGVVRTGATPGSDAILSDLPALTPSVLYLDYQSGRCRVTTSNPVVIELDSARDAQGVAFTAECTAAAIDTLDGQVVTSAYPVQSASVRMGSGETLRMTGPLLGDLLQLSGNTIRVWGVRAGTSLDVYGYEIRSSLGEPRWVGVVTARNGKLWLYGKRAIELVNAPAALAADVGAYVWVGGEETDVDVVVPKVYGVIREAGS
jgi:hypothetical protein